MTDISIIVAETTSWHDKKVEVTFADIILPVRRSIWYKLFSKSANDGDFLKIVDQEATFVIDKLVSSTLSAKIEHSYVVHGSKWIPALWAHHAVFSTCQRVSRHQGMK